MMRWVLLLHRWLGILFGWLLVAWCASGLVMMYVGYPRLTLERELNGLRPLALDECCLHMAFAELDASAAIAGFRVEMLAGHPVVRLRGTWPDLIDLRSGTALDLPSHELLQSVADDFQRDLSVTRPARYLGSVEVDQWTIGVPRYTPLALFELGDAQHTRIYLDDTGEVVQLTTARQRLWNWFGSVTHWIYPTLLRQHTTAWIQVIIWASVIGLFLTVLGLYVGIHQFKRRRSGRWSPYHGIAWWHHIAGLCFGVLTLTWLVSGLLSVNPWGLLEGESAGSERQRLERAPLRWGDAVALLEALPNLALPADTVRFMTAPLNGTMYYLASTRNGQIQRYDTTLARAPLRLEDIREAARVLRPEEVDSVALLQEGDEYYFDHHITRPLPVFRVIMADAQQTRYYLDADSGALLLKADQAQRWHRWLFAGLHRLDFTPTLRQRPFWDALMWTLMLGVTAICFTGTYMGLRYLRRRARPRARCP